MSLEWTNNPIRFFQHLLRESDAKNLDVKSLISEVTEVGAGGYIAMGGGFSAWYPTARTSQTINPYLDFDFLGTVIDAAKENDIRVLVRMDISKGRAGMDGNHPDWFVRREDGSVSKVWDMPQICATGPFWQDEVFAILDEIITRYPLLDGFFFNYLHVPRCFCSRCVKIVWDSTGGSVPSPSVRAIGYERWRQNFLADHMARVRRFIRARHQGAALVPYHHVHDGWDIRRMAEISDVIGSQVSNPVIPNPVDPQPMWNFWAAEEALTARALKPETAPILIQTSSEVFASRQTSMPSARLVHNLIQAAAHGANTAPAVNGLLSQSDTRFVPALRDFGDYQLRAEEWYRDLQSAAKVAIVKSEDSRLWGRDDGRAAGTVDGRGHVSEFRGLFEILADLRYPCDVLVAGNLDRKKLAAYDAMVLPAVEALSQDDAELIDAFVAAGGQIFVTADTGRTDENGRAKVAAALNCLPGLPGDALDVTGAYFDLDAPQISRAFGGIPHIAAAGDFWPVNLANDSDCLRLIGPYANNAPEFTVVEGPGKAPGVIARRFGKGRATWLPWRIGSLYHQFSVPEYRTLFAALIEPAIGLPPVKTSASSAVETILYRRGETDILHLLNGAAARQKVLTELTPLAGFDVAVTTGARRAIQIGDGREVPSTRNGDQLVLHIDRLEGFMAIALLSSGS